ncbi:MAG TPA: SDR family NAD(P)-dependent oxidoreductase [Kofleriaceae bacterium]|nr:SDR family NAD(P)-dependent oxidoreductase [Kofleriaceae bacterium]
MTAGGRIAVVTGANQGLGYALVEGLCRALAPDDVVYLTGRDEGRVREATERLRADGVAPRPAVLDVSDAASVTGFAERIAREHDGVDIVISNAAHRIVREEPQAAQVRRFVQTNNLGTTHMLERFAPLLRDGGRLLVVASGFGRLRHLAPPLHARFDRAESLRAVDDVMLAYVDAVERGTAAAEGWPEWVNIASKVGQVASTRVLARAMRAEAERRHLVIDAVCPGLVDTAASRPWFDDMSKAQTPAAAAADIVWLATAPYDPALPYGELVRHREILSWAE